MIFVHKTLKHLHRYKLACMTAQTSIHMSVLTHTYTCRLTHIHMYEQTYNIHVCIISVAAGKCIFT